jgi:hypothetical protein
MSSSTPDPSPPIEAILQQLGTTVLEVVRAVPVLKPVLDKHLEVQDEMLATFLMSELTEALVGLVEAGDSESVASFLAQVERLAASSNIHERNLIIVSFVEDLALGSRRANAALATIRPQLGPATSAMLAALEAKLAERRAGQADAP